VRWVVLDGHYTLSEPGVKIALPVPHAVAADFDKRNSLSLASPLREGLCRKAGDLRDILGREQRHRRCRCGSCVHEFCRASHVDLSIPIHFSIFHELLLSARLGTRPLRHRIADAGKLDSFEFDGAVQERPSGIHGCYRHQNPLSRPVPFLEKGERERLENRPDVPVRS
jgi:hypothetical protein